MSETTSHTTKRTSVVDGDCRSASTELTGGAIVEDECACMENDRTRAQFPFYKDVVEAAGTRLTVEQKNRLMWRSGVSIAFAAGLDNRAYTDASSIKERVVSDLAGYYGYTPQFANALGEAFDAGSRTDAILNA